MNTIKLYGASDDLIEVEGDVSGCDEYNGADAHFVLVGASAQTRIRVWYTARGVWAISAAPTDEDVAMLPVSINNAETGYSAEATVEGVHTIIREATS